VELVKAQFVLHPEEDQDTAGDADGKACDVDKRITFVFFLLPGMRFSDSFLSW